MPFVTAALAFALAAQSTAIFNIRPDDFWLNLHKFLYVLGRAENRAADARQAPVADAPADADRPFASLTDDERRAWMEAISAYAHGPSRQDPTRDTALALLEGRLADAGESPTLNTGVDDAVRIVLERAAPIYRKAWWASHRASNHAWSAATDQLIATHGPTVLAFIRRAYGLPWPTQGYPVHIVTYASWAGAYSTDGNLLVVSSNARAGTTGWAGLETVFHESIHQWDEPIEAILNADARAIGKRLPRNLSHAIVFFTAGEAVRRVAPPGYVPLADATGAWSRGMNGLKDALEATWLPYLNGRGTRDEALAALVQRTANGPAPPLFTFQTDDFWLNLHHFLHRIDVRSDGNSASDLGQEPVGCDRSRVPIEAAADRGLEAVLRRNRSARCGARGTCEACYTMKSPILMLGCGRHVRQQLELPDPSARPDQQTALF